MSLACALQVIKVIVGVVDAFTANNDTIVAKEVSYSTIRMSRRLGSKDEMAYEGDETHISESVMPSYLRAKFIEGKGMQQG